MICENNIAQSWIIDLNIATAKPRYIDSNTIYGYTPSVYVTFFLRRGINISITQANIDSSSLRISKDASGNDSREPNHAVELGR